MNRNFYVIIGPDDDGQNQQYWDALEWEWTAEFGAATRYDGHVFWMPLPPMAEGIMEFSENNCPIGWHDPSYPPIGEVVFTL